jgi:hypothetical protein
VIGEILGKALVVVKGDTSHARAEIAKLSAAEQAAAKARIKAQEESNAALERGNQKFGLYVAAAAAGWAVVSSSVKKYEEHLKSLGKSGEDELLRLQNVTGSLSKAQDNLQIAIGKVAMAAEPAALALAAMANELARIVGGVGDLLNKAKDLLPGGGPQDVTTDQQSWRYGRLGLDPRLAKAMTVDETPGWTGGRDSPEGSTMSPEWYRAMGYRLVMTSDGGYTWLPPEKKKPGRGAPQRDPYSDVWRDVINPAISATSGSARGDGFESERWTTTPSDADLLGLAGDTFKGSDLGQIGEYDFPALKAIQESMDRAFSLEEGRKRRESMLENIFGPVEEFELYTTAWQGLESVVTAGLNAWISGGQSAGEAMKMALHGFAKNLAGEALLQAMRHTAYGFGMAAFPDPLSRASSAQHFAAAAKWGVVAVAAAGIGKVTAPAAGTSGGGAGAYAAAGIGGSTAPSQQGVQYTAVFGDAFAADSPRYVARRTRRNLDNARMHADYEAPP